MSNVRMVLAMNGKGEDSVGRTKRAKEGKKEKKVREQRERGNSSLTLLTVFFLVYFNGGEPLSIGTYALFFFSSDTPCAHLPPASLSTC
jgi:hypothetical protein